MTYIIMLTENTCVNSGNETVSKRNCRKEILNEPESGAELNQPRFLHKSRDTAYNVMIYMRRILSRWIKEKNQSVLRLL